MIVVIVGDPKTGYSADFTILPVLFNLTYDMLPTTVHDKGFAVIGDNHPGSSKMA